MWYERSRKRPIVPLRSPALATIIPRWEWRSFGADFGAAEAALAASTPGPFEESDELYLLSAAGANVKVRYDLLDIKLLREVDGDGLERWEPVMKTAFPLPAAEVAKVFEALGVASPPPTRDAYTLDQFLAELVEPGGVVRAVRVHKRRVSATRSPAAWPRSPTWRRTAESRGPSRSSRRTRPPSSAAIRRLGLDSQVNTSYPRGLWARSTMDPQRHAVIDVGTNSVKFHVGERDPDGSWRAIVDRAELTRLGEGLEDQRSDRGRAAGADGGRDCGHGRGGDAPPACGRPPRWAPPGCGSPATATRSSRRSGPAPGSPWR